MKQAIGVVAGMALSLTVGLAGLSTPAQADDGTHCLDQLSRSSISEYRLVPSDRVRVTVFGEEDLSGEFEVDATGVISLPLIGEMQAQGLTPRQVERRIEEQFADGYLVNPRVNTEVTTYGPFFIVGEVNTAGQFPFEPGMTILKAVSTAGGYTYRANRRRVYVTREDVCADEVEVPADSTLLVMPGDVIRVPERIF